MRGKYPIISQYLSWIICGTESEGSSCAHKSKMQFRSAQLLLLLFKTSSGFKGLKQQFKRKESDFSLPCSPSFPFLFVFDLLDQR